MTPPPTQTLGEIGEKGLLRRIQGRIPSAPGVVVGLGDDAAAVETTPFSLVTTDSLVEGVHFLLDAAPPRLLGRKALAVNLSDLAACGAEPRCFFLALALPKVDEAWLAAFSGGMFALADAHRCVLAGGDTTRSPQGVIITVTVMGSVPRGQALI